MFVDTLCNCAKGSADSHTLEVLLLSNVIWLTVIRPFVFLLWNPDNLFVDIGSHLVLTITSVFSPIFPFKNRQVENLCQIEFTLVSSHLTNSNRPPAELLDEN